MKKLVMSSVLAVASLFTVSACTSVGANTDTATSTKIQNQYKDGQHKGDMHKGGKRGGFATLNLSSTQQTQIQAIKQNSNLDRTQKRAAMMQVLTAEQRATLDTIKSKRSAKGYGKSKTGGMRGGFAALNLSSTQQTQIQAIRQNSNLDRTQKRAAMMQVLTAEQRTTLETLKSKRSAKK